MEVQAVVHLHAAQAGTVRKGSMISNALTASAPSTHAASVMIYRFWGRALPFVILFILHNFRKPTAGVPIHWDGRNLFPVSFCLQLQPHIAEA